MRAENGRMKSESYTRPSIADVRISADRKSATIVFAENVEEVEKKHNPHKNRKKPIDVNTENEINETAELSAVFIFDRYVLCVAYREGLENEITANPQPWLEMAKKVDYDNAAECVRAERDKLLADVDWTQMSDTALSEEKKTAYKNYRQQLRDIPEQPGFPYNVKYPTKP